MYTFNILNFEHPKEKYTFYFTDQEDDTLHRVYKTLVPDEVTTHFGEQEHYYMSYDTEIPDGLVVTKDSKPSYKIVKDKQGENKRVKLRNTCFTSSILKRYYNWLIFSYFKNKGALVKSNFILDVEIWFRCTKETDSEFAVFEKYCLKVQIAKLSSHPELLLSYEGKSKVFRKSIAVLGSEISPTVFNWVIYNKILWKYEELPEEAQRNKEKVYPVWNFDIRNELCLTTPAPDRTNKYKRFHDNITEFYKRYLNTESFKAIIPLNGKGFLPVEASTMGNVSKGSNSLAFYGKKLSIVPMDGLKSFGPLEISRHSKIHFFYILHEDDAAVGMKLHNYFKGEERGFRGLYKFIKTDYYSDRGVAIKFKSRENPVPEIERALKNISFADGVKYIAVYISPYSKNTTDKEQREIYYKVKEMLLKRNITSQVVDASKVDGPTYHFSLPNIAIAILAKLDGIPWRLDTTIKNELIVGVGAFKHLDTDTQYIGSAFSFSNNGSFNQFDCFRKDQICELAGSIIQAVKDYVSVNKNINRLIIHFYKNMSNKELEPIERGLKEELGLHIPVFIISINKTESQDIVAFDHKWTELMPESGTFINLGRGKFLLFNNTRYGESHKSHEGFPFPIKMGIYCTDEEKTKDTKTIKELIDQVYQFSRMYWKSVSQQNLPVTIKYPEMVAEIFPHFDGNEIPDFGKSNLWFL